MGGQQTVQPVLDHITFGHGIHFLLEVLLLQFATVFLTFQFSNSLLVEISNPNLFIGAYAGATAVFLGVLILFTAKMRKRTFSPPLHARHRIAVSMIGYLAVSGVVMIFGYVLLVLATTGGTGFSRLDWVFSAMLTTLFAALLAVGYHSRVSGKQPDRDTITETITAWQDSLSWVDEDDRDHAKQQAYEEFNELTNELSELLSKAKTVHGKQLREEFQAWRAEFEGHSELSKETIIKGQGENRNENLHQAHQELESIRRRLRIIAGEKT